MPGGRVAVVGGSVAGCAAALAAHRSGATEVTVYERAAGRLADRGVGLAVHDARYAELEAAGYLDAAMPYIRLSRRRWYVREGSALLGRPIGTLPFPFRTYNWGPLWRELRARVPASVTFRTGTPVESVTARPDGAELRTASGTERFDLVIGADGYRSTVRTAAFAGPYADARPRYAGYLAWRGAFPVDRLPDPGPWDVAECAYVVFPGGHVIVYRIPDGRGGHRANWVLFTAPPPGHRAAPHTREATGPLRDHLARVVETRLPPYWADLIRLTAPDELFMQPMYDFSAPRYAIGALALTGDAATVARPHTGAGAVKALQDAVALEASAAAATTWRQALAAYDTDRTAAGRTMADLGRRLGRALVEETPDWHTMDQSALEAFWRRADASGAFGGRGPRR
ncbi:FAD-dependent monooxygenase [Streptomyces sp. SP18CS02]|uniref:FAD-dependent monooxygenase n=1 Tax=Streptomyces sp. SP18CS02 TaxID=3002531 RepID=UPI002E76E593|nr:FAD-dependent monooxygenase [Streptomyces sp. SP18CS02]MEE1753835.1 FAD-dependent monooxygenase [Streptomyces sp. SP18CS02]